MRTLVGNVRLRLLLALGVLSVLANACVPEQEEPNALAADGREVEDRRLGSEALTQPAPRPEWHLANGEEGVAFELDPSLPPDSEIAAPGNQRRARVAGGDGTFLVVWEDDRTGIPSIYGTRVDPIQGALDKGGVLIGEGPAFSPRVAFNGAYFVVAWSTGLDVRAAKIDASIPAGMQVTIPQVLSFGSPDQVVALAASPDGYVVVVRDGLAAPLTKLIALADAPGGLVSLSLGQSSIQEGDTVGLTYCDGAYRFAIPRAATPALELTARSTTTLTTLLPWTAMSTAQTPRSTALGCNASGTLAAWEELGSPSPGSLRTQIVAPTTTTAVTLATAAQLPRRPSIAPYGTSFLVAWEEAFGRARQLSQAEIDADGEVGFTESLAPYQAVDVAATTGVNLDALYVFEPANVSLPAPPSDVLGMTEPIFGDPLLLSTQPNAQVDLAAAATNDTLLVAWTDLRNGKDRGVVRFLALDANGAPVGKALPVDPGAATSDRDPAITSHAAQWLIAWSAVDTFFDPLKKLEVALGTGSVTTLRTSLSLSDGPLEFRNPAAAWSGDHYTVVYEGGVTTCTTSCAYAPALLGVAAVTPDGVASFSENLGVAARSPAVAATKNGTAIVLWERDGSLYASTLKNGTALVETNTPLFLEAAGRHSKPSLVFRDDAAEGLLVWENASIAGNRILAVVVGEDMKPLHKPVVVSQSLASARPSVSLDGPRYFIVWEGSEAGGVTQAYGAAVRFDGTLADATPKRLSLAVVEAILPGPPDPGGDPGGSLSSLAGQTTTPNFVRTTSGARYLFDAQVIPKLGVPRAVGLRLAAEGVLGTPCSNASECGSRYCVDGVCCDSECTGTCMQCGGDPAFDSGGTPGICAPAKDRVDDTCNDGLFCATDGACRIGTGGRCKADGDCATGHCFNETYEEGNLNPILGYCCDTACDGPCDSCVGANFAGVCTTAACGNFSCVLSDPATGGKQCIESCQDSSECTAGHQCVAGDCVKPSTVGPMSDGCGITAPHPVRSSQALLVLAMAALGAARRRRKE